MNSDPNATVAEKEYLYWKVTFSNFIDESKENAPNKLHSLIKYVSALIYEFISDCTSFEAVINILDKFFIKKKHIT